MPEARRHGEASWRAGTPAYDRLEGRLDLDALDTPLDLDVIGAGTEGPQLLERLGVLLERLGVTPFVRRHRRPLLGAVLVAAAVTAAVGTWWWTRPEPLPETPRVLVTASGSDRTQVGLGPADGGLVRLTLDVAVVSSERPGVAVALLSLTGPALSPPHEGATDLGSAAAAGTSATVSATIDCASAATTSAGLRADGSEYGVQVRRTAPEGEVRVDTVVLVGAQRLARVVRQTCLQAAADRELTLVSLAATPLGGLPAADLDITVRNSGSRVWPGLRFSTNGQPWIVNEGSPADLAPGGRVTLHARLWPRDCADPSGQLADGVQVRTSFAADDAVPYSADDVGNTFHLLVDPAGRARVASTFASVCSVPAPTATVVQADFSTGGSADSAGTLGLTLAVRSPGAELLIVDGGGPTAGGLLSPVEIPLHLRHGVGVLHAAWRLPRCADLLVAGVAPRFAVSLVPLSGGQPRPYLMALSGDDLRLALVRACGDEARPLVP